MKIHSCKYFQNNLLIYNIKAKTLGEFIKFGLVGICNTCIHGAIFLLLTSFGNSQLVANIAAFTTATIFSYISNTFWSFRKKHSTTVMYRFALVSMVGLIISSNIAAAADHFHINKYVTFFCLICILPFVNFILHKFWTYKTFGITKSI